MNAKKKSWNFKGHIIYENQVRIYEADDYISGELLAPFCDLLTMMKNDQDDWSPMARVGAVGLPLADIATTRTDQLFTLLRNQNIVMQVIVVAGYITGIPAGTPIAVEMVNTQL